MKKSKIFRLLSLMVCLTIAFYICSTPIIASNDVSFDLENTFELNNCEDSIEDTVIIDPVQDEEYIDYFSPDQLNYLKPGDKTIDELQKLTVDLNSLHELINSDTAVEKGHVNRLYQQEKNLNSIIYQNKDGTKSAYIFSKPVKYINNDGIVCDKSSEISVSEQNGFSYNMINNNVHVYFPDKIYDGTLIQFNDYSILMSPDTNYAGQLKYSSDDNTIEYVDAFGTGVSIIYHTKLNGLKEDIVLYQKTEKNEFSFKMTLNGVTPINKNNSWFLINQDEKIIASFGKIYIHDEVGNAVIGNMDILGVDEQGKYEVNITVPESFLYDDSTVYPVYIDPSTYIWEEGYYDDNPFYYNAITDTGIYSSVSAATNAQNNPDYHKLGRYSSAGGKIIYKLYDFYGEYGAYTDLLDCQIGHADLYINVGSGDSATLRVNPMTSTWDVNTYGENPIAFSNSTIWGSYSSNYLSTASIGTSSDEYAIDITNILKGWARYNAGLSIEDYDNPANGFVLSSNLARTYRDVTAVDEFYNDNVYVLLDISDYGGSYYINNLNSGEFLEELYYSLNMTTYLNISTLKWYVEYVGNDNYIIRSLHITDYALSGSGSNVSLGYLPENPSDNFLWKIYPYVGGLIIKNTANNKVLCYDEKNLSLVTPMSSGDDNYPHTVWGIILTSNYVNLSSFTVSYPEWTAIGSSINCTFNVTPVNATWNSRSNFKWESDNPNVASIDSSGRITAVSNGYTNIRITHKPTGTKKVIQLVVGEMLDSVKYYHIKNIYSSKYVELEAINYQSGTYIEQHTYHDADYAKWRFIFAGSGYYYIQSKYSGLYIGIEGTSYSSGAAIIQTATQSSASKWKVLVTENGNYKFVSYLSGLAISLPSETMINGTNLQQTVYSNNSIYTDEWLIQEKNDVSLIAIPETYSRDSFFGSAATNLASLGYNTNVFAKTVCMNHNFLINRLQNSKITVVRTHGNQTAIKTSNDYINVTKMNNLPSNALSYSELIIYGSCMTGKGRELETNLVNATYSAGANIVIGFEETVYSNEVNYWCQGFFDALADGKTVEEACREADAYVNTEWHDGSTTDSWYIAGDTETIF